MADDFLYGIDGKFHRLLQLSANEKRNDHALSRPREDRLTTEIADLHNLSIVSERGSVGIRTYFSEEEGRINGDSKCRVREAHCFSPLGTCCVFLLLSFLRLCPRYEK